MNTLYKQLLNSAKIISEDEFDKLVNILPKEHITPFSDEIYPDDLTNIDLVGEFIINTILNNLNFTAFISDLDIENKTFYINDVYSTKELDEIFNLFSEWEIINYYELYGEVKEIEETEKRNIENYKKMEIFNIFVDKISLEELIKIKEKYDKK